MSRQGIATLAGWVPETTHVFAATVADNVRLARPSSDDADCLAALDASACGRGLSRSRKGWPPASVPVASP